MNKLDILKSYFNYDSFRDGQEEIIDSILNKINTLSIMPTGGGKSICFQVPGLLLDGVSLVISPLISLMVDQVNNLVKKGISARYLNSMQSNYEKKLVLDELKNNKIKFLYIAPEKLKNDEFIKIINSVNVSQIVLDEAHAMSLYGHDFRPDYKTIGQFLNKLNSTPVVSAFTATASQSVINDIKEIVGVKFKIFKFGFDRKNLYYGVIESNDELKDLLNILNKYKNETVIVYTLTRKMCEKIYQFLKEKNYNVGLYHGGLDKEVKDYYNNLFLSKKINILIATNAYGMGIDTIIRVVINVGFPMSLEDLAQQQGRAGRDNKLSYCYLIYNMKDLYYNEYFINSIDDYDIDINEKKVLKKIKKEKLKEVIGYATTKRCLHEYLVSHFGELYMSYCNNCSNCLKEKKEIDATYDAKLVIDTIKLTKERYGSNIISKILVGSKDKNIKSKYLNKIKTYNKTSSSIDEVKDVISNLIHDGYINRTCDEYPILKLNENSEIIYKLEKYNIKK